MRVAVIGFGMMGRQIAQVFAQHGSEVAVTDENPVAVKSGLDEVAHGPYGIESAVAKAKITREEGAKTLFNGRMNTLLVGPSHALRHRRRSPRAHAGATTWASGSSAGRRR